MTSFFVLANPGTKRVWRALPRLVASLVLASTLGLIGSLANAQTTTTVSIDNGQGTLDSTKNTAPRFARLDFSSPASAEHTITVSWDSDADVRFKVKESDGTNLSPTIRESNPGTWSGVLDANTDYFIGMWSHAGIANYTVTIETSAETNEDVPLAITRQPSGLTVIEGETAEFTVQATGNGPLEYQWFANDEAIPGATDRTYTLAAIQLSESGTAYTVNVSDASGSTATSDVAILTVEQENAEPVTVTTLGQGTLDSTRNAAPRYTRLDFESLAATEHTITVTWDSSADVRFRVKESDGTNLSPTIRGSNPGTWTGVLDANTTYFMGLWSFSGIADYTVTLEANLALAITSQPADVTVSAGDDAEFVVEAVGNGPLSYLWFIDGSPLSNENTNSLILPETSVADDGMQFSVEVSNDTETISSRVATLTVTDPEDEVLPPQTAGLYSQESDVNAWILDGPAPTLDYNASEPLSSWGRVLLRIDDVLLVGGDFEGIRATRDDPVTARAWLAALDAITGQPISTFQVPPDVDSVVRSLVLSPDSDKVYVGGDFGLLALDAQTGALDFAVNIRQGTKSGRVFDIAVDETHIYIGGEFTRIGNVSLKHIARLSHNGNIDNSWRPDIRGGFNNGREAPVQAVALSPSSDAIYVGGNFTSINRVDVPRTNRNTQVSMLVVDTGEDATVRAERFTPVVQKTNRVKVRDIAVTEDYVIIAWGGPNHLGFHSHDGARLHQYDGTGDTQGLKVVGNLLYVAHHGEFFGSLENPIPPEAVLSLSPEIVVAYKFHSFRLDASGFPFEQAWRIEGFFGVWGISVAEDSIWVSGQISLAGSNLRPVNGLARFPANVSGE